MLNGALVIKNGDWEAHILPEKGANPVKLTYKGEDVFRPLEDVEALKINPFLWRKSSGGDNFSYGSVLIEKKRLKKQKIRPKSGKNFKKWDITA